jgi:hypothetical protein
MHTLMSLLSLEGLDVLKLGTTASFGNTNPLDNFFFTKLTLIDWISRISSQRDGIALTESLCHRGNHLGCGRSQRHWPGFHVMTHLYSVFYLKLIVWLGLRFYGVNYLSGVASPCA